MQVLHCESWGSARKMAFRDIPGLEEFRWQKLGEDISLYCSIMLHSTIILAFLNGLLGIQHISDWCGFW